MVRGSVFSRCCSTLAVRFLVAVVLSDVTTLTSVSALSSSRWRSERGRTVTSSVKTTRTASKLQCFLRCYGMDSCYSAAFDSAASTCFLQPTHQAFAEGDAGRPLNVFTMESKCKPSDAPDFPNGHLGAWHLTSSSMEADVICVVDYVLTTDETLKVSCQRKTGQWATLVPIPCKQAVWRDNTVKTRPEGEYPLPRTAQVGWAVCLSATPTTNNVFAVDLDASNGDKPLHIASYVSFETTVLNHVHGGTWGSSPKNLFAPSAPFPFQQGQEFSMTIRADSSNTFDIYVEGTFYGSRTVPLSVSDVAKVTFNLDVQVRYLNVWC